MLTMEIIVFIFSIYFLYLILKLINKYYLNNNTFEEIPLNNSYKNLQALCICCHANYGKHLIKPKHMKLMHDECLDIRKKQGCTT